jgi:stage IV sporulation protein FB
MFFFQPNESPYDLQFSFFGFHTRIAWTFWLVAVVLGYDLARGVDRMFAGSSPGVLPLLVIWAACIMVSILIHELGHTIAFRWYGIEASILLYHFGGLAIPAGARWGGRSSTRMRSIDELVVAAAGPAFQIGSAILLTLLVWLLGYRVFAFFLMPGPLAAIGHAMDGNDLDVAAAFALVNFYVLPSILWGLLNLLPVLPLDGGRIAQSLIMISGGELSQARWLGVIASVVIAIYAFQSGNHFLGIFFIWMGIDNYQAINPGSSWR